ncbi:unnamed protein product, partial [Allacma fusca]
KSDRPNSSVQLTQRESPQAAKIKPTAIVQVYNANGEGVNCRALIDNCSDDCFIEESLVKKLNLKKQTLPHHQNIEALEGKLVATATESVQLELSSLYHPQIQINLTALVIKKIGGRYPRESLDASNWNHIPKIGLADPHFNESTPVNILLSTDIHYRIIRSGLLRGNENDPVSQESIFGWLVGGGTATSNPTKSICNLTDLSLETQIQQFWKLEDCSNEVNRLTPQELNCEDHYNRTTTVLPDGTFEVQLPFHADKLSLGNSKFMATKRFHSLEMKFSRNSDLKVQYTKAIHELLADGHLEEVPRSEFNIPDDEVYYLPHHPVMKESSTTKLRIVFDASAKTSSGVSLNEQLLVGPVLQDDLTSILIRWRYWLVPFKADVKQMYLYISMHSPHRNFQRILWRDHPQQQVKMFRLKKVTFGVASSPYQAIKTLQTLAMKQRHKYPHA